jgi:phenylacetic acid degradation operon negative regulatory protein
VAAVLSIEKQMLFLLSHTDAMDAQELIRIYEKRGYSAPYIRNALSRLKKEAYADSPSRSAYRITEAGRTFIRSINRKPELYDRTWDGTWHFVMASFPESERKRRDSLRSDLLQTGYGQLYGGVYVSPWPYREETAELLRKHQAERYVTVAHGAVEHGRIDAEAAVSIWSLGEVARHYDEQWAWFEGSFLPEAALSPEEAAEPLELFVRYLHLGEVVSNLYLLDPMLPEELLPIGWQGRSRLNRMRETIDAIARAIPASSPYARFVR